METVYDISTPYEYYIGYIAYSIVYIYIKEYVNREQQQSKPLHVIHGSVQ